MRGAAGLGWGEGNSTNMPSLKSKWHSGQTKRHQARNAEVTHGAVVGAHRYRRAGKSASRVPRGT